MIQFNELAQEVRDRIQKLEKHTFGETREEWDARQFQKGLEGRSISRFRYTGGRVELMCHKCLLRMNEQFEPVEGYSNEFLIFLGRTPLEKRCQHKKGA